MQWLLVWQSAQENPGVSVVLLMEEFLHLDYFWAHRAGWTDKSKSVKCMELTKELHDWFKRPMVKCNLLSRSDKRV